MSVFKLVFHLNIYIFNVKLFFANIKVLNIYILANYSKSHSQQKVKKPIPKVVTVKCF